MADNKQQMGFDEKLQRIEEINRQLADGKIDLEKSVSLFEEGMALAKSLESDLQKLERRIEIVTNDPEPDGTQALETADFEPEARQSS